jgi:flagella basal body P-ring formation protein FlgA
MAKSKIEKGETISAKDVEEGDFKLNSVHQGIVLLNGQVIGSTASHALKAGQLLAASDFKRSQKPAPAIESKTSSDLDNSSLFFLAGICVFVSIPFLAIVTSYIWIVRIAFQKSAAEGFYCLCLSPFAIPSFAMENWNRTRPPFLLLLVGCALLGLVGGMMISGKISEQQISLTKACQFGEAEARLEMKRPVIYTLKDIPAGRLISADAVTTKQLQIDQIPQDAMTNPSAAIGKKVKYGMEPNQILSVHDLQ